MKPYHWTDHIHNQSKIVQMAELNHWKISSWEEKVVEKSKRADEEIKEKNPTRTENPLWRKTFTWKGYERLGEEVREQGKGKGKFMRKRIEDATVEVVQEGGGRRVEKVKVRRKVKRKVREREDEILSPGPIWEKTLFLTRLQPRNKQILF